MRSFIVGIPTQCVPDLHFLPQLGEHFLRLRPIKDQIEPKCHEGVPRACGDVMGQGWEWSLEVNLDFTWIPTSRCSVNLTCVGSNLVFAVHKSL